MNTHNNYDAFAEKRQQELRNGTKLSHRYVEKPMMLGMLPSVVGKRGIMLGCGTGEESVFLREAGARELLGIDQSPASIALARQTYPENDFMVGDMHSLDIRDADVDFIYSSLVVHYSSDPTVVYREAWRILKPGGFMLLSLGHPLRWASTSVEINGTPTRVIGSSEDKAHPHLYGKYNTFEEHSALFPGGEELRFWIAAPSFHFKLLREAGFIVEDFSESQAIHEVEAVDPYYYQRYSEFPQFMAFLVRKG